jgi:hypothetical protein
VTAGRRLAVAGAVLVALFAAALVVGAFVIRPAGNVASPSHSRLHIVEDLFPPRRLRAADIHRGGPSCLHGNTLVVPAGGGCTFILPKGVHVAVFRRVPGSPGMIVTLNQTGDLTQNIDTAMPGPDPSDPLRIRLAAVQNGDTVTLSACQGPAACRLDLSP